MLARIALYTTLGYLLDGLGCRWDTAGFWCMVGLFWACEAITRIELVEQLNQELELMRKQRKEKPND